MENDQDLFIEFYEKYKNKLLTYLMYRLNFNREVSEDLLMDIVLKAYEKFDSYDQKKGSFKNWIFTIAHNHLTNYWRDMSKRQTIDIDNEQLNGELKTEQKFNENLDKKIELDRVKEVLSKMDRQHSELIILKYIHDFNTEEIAKILKKRKGAIRTGLTRAITKFKEIYKKLYNYDLQ